MILTSLLLGVILATSVQTETIEISTYSKVAKSGASLLKPNVSESSTSHATGRALGGGSYPMSFEGLLTRPVKYRTSSYQDSYKAPKYIVYPSNSQSTATTRLSPSRDIAMDRFAPGEAYGGTVYKILKSKQKGYQYQKPNDPVFDDSRPVSAAPPPPPPPAPIISASPPPVEFPQASSVITAPTPAPPDMSSPDTIPNNTAASADWNKFPPNSDTSWPNPMKSPQSYDSPITSYLSPNPPSSKPPTPDSPPSNQYIPPPDLYKFPPNLNSNYLPPPSSDGQFRFNGISSYLPPPAGPTDPSDSGAPSDSDDMEGTISVGPERPQYLPPLNPSYLPPNNPPQLSPAQPSPMGMPMQNLPPPQMMMPMNPMMKDVMNGPPPDHSFPFAFDEYDHFPHHHHHHDHYPEYEFDHHHHDETTTAPPPPPPPEPATARVKNYSYYYISRTLWYVPLYFTLYFTFYVLILILRSIARHKVNIPNQWVGSRSLEAMPHLTNAQVTEKVNMMTNFVMKQIDEFKEKYMG
ncbi:uncharacterized protein LOC129772890 [Toxorhynchites rutilus septentrionalis]|uniref:uncharacterized protein LOC129772890 n=1 Tax=Toxorhynchites rutilus septentrionalis TaxID=329112 RepID=UPI002478F8C1|nr:uncharacterized protein LOC129772890 [Toxorhynchites rutilus septentrionalis]